MSLYSLDVGAAALKTAIEAVYALLRYPQTSLHYHLGDGLDELEVDASAEDLAADLEPRLGPGGYVCFTSSDAAMRENVHFAVVCPPEERQRYWSAALDFSGLDLSAEVLRAARLPETLYVAAAELIGPDVYDEHLEGRVELKQCSNQVLFLRRTRGRSGFSGWCNRAALRRYAELGWLARVYRALACRGSEG